MLPIDGRRRSCYLLIAEGAVWFKAKWNKNTIFTSGHGWIPTLVVRQEGELVDHKTNAITKAQNAL